MNRSRLYYVELELEQEGKHSYKSFYWKTDVPKGPGCEEEFTRLLANLGIQRGHVASLDIVPVNAQLPSWIGDIELGASL